MRSAASACFANMNSCSAIPPAAMRKATATLDADQREQSALVPRLQQCYAWQPDNSNARSKAQPLRGKCCAFNITPQTAKLPQSLTATLTLGGSTSQSGRYVLRPSTTAKPKRCASARNDWSGLRCAFVPHLLPRFAVSQMERNTKRTATLSPCSTSQLVCSRSASTIISTAT